MKNEFINYIDIIVENIRQHNIKFEVLDNIILY